MKSCKTQFVNLGENKVVHHVYGPSSLFGWMRRTEKILTLYKMAATLPVDNNYTAAVLSQYNDTAAKI